MTITTGSYPKGLGGGKATVAEDNMEMQAGDTPAKKSGDKSFLGAQDKGYSPRKAMAAGMLKAE